MGSYNNFCVDISLTLSSEQKLLDEIIAEGKKIEEGWLWCFRKWTGQTKWQPYDLVIALSKKFPTVLFSVNAFGESCNGKDFYLNGEELRERFVLSIPSFPTINQFKKASKINLLRKTREADLRVKKEAELKTQAEKERIKELQEEISNSKKELKKLKEKEL